MGYIPKISTIIILLGIFSFGTTGHAVTGDFVVPANHDYYPETVLTLQLANLTTDSYYGLKIGSNQLLQDQEWDNFTATSASMNRTVIHFDTESYLNNQSQPMTFLLCELFAIDNDTHYNPSRLSLISYQLVTVSDQINPYAIGMVLLVVIGSLVFFTIMLEFVKFFL